MKERERVRRLIERRSRSNAIVYLQIIVLSTALVWLLVSIKSLSTSLSSAFNALADMGVTTAAGSGDSTEGSARAERASGVGVRVVTAAPPAQADDDGSHDGSGPGSGGPDEEGSAL